MPYTPFGPMNIARSAGAYARPSIRQYNGRSLLARSRNKASANTHTNQHQAIRRLFRFHIAILFGINHPAGVGQYRHVRFRTRKTQQESTAAGATQFQC